MKNNIEIPLQRTAAALLAAVMAFSLAACSSTNGSGNAGTSDQEKPADSGDEENSGGDAAAADKIIIFQSKVEIQDQLEDCAEAFTEETGIEVEIWGTTGDGFLQEL